ncbi:hypothetical protein C0J52_01975 [Blattella germanica]|nr:hypothetical protein C0J52_01975 [Blattella germanica]
MAQRQRKDIHATIAKVADRLTVREQAQIASRYEIFHVSLYRRRPRMDIHAAIAKMADRLTAYSERAQIASRYEVWNSVVVVQ